MRHSVPADPEEACPKATPQAESKQSKRYRNRLIKMRPFRPAPHAQRWFSPKPKMVFPEGRAWSRCFHRNLASYNTLPSPWQLSVRPGSGVVCMRGALNTLSFPRRRESNFYPRSVEAAGNGIPACAGMTADRMPYASQMTPLPAPSMACGEFVCCSADL